LWQAVAEGKSGSVISILTTWVWSGGPFTVPSAMSKAGLNVMTQSLAVEWGPKNIRFNAIAPGPFYTEGMTARLNPGASADSYQSMRGNPMGRAGDLRELANMAVWLLHPFSAYVNGQTIAIDGGSWNAGGGAFSSLRDWTDDDWARARAMIRDTNEQDRAKRTV
jgi:NAD(P)-dependent dehydrogenase (short-subunit alcohol dehydrogenase family)